MEREWILALSKPAFHSIKEDLAAYKFLSGNAGTLTVAGGVGTTPARARLAVARHNKISLTFMSIIKMGDSALYNIF